MYINTNISNSLTRNYLRINQAGLQDAMERLSSGKRINSAGDDAAGLSISTRMTSQIRGKDVAIRNANDGISLIQTAEGALGSITNILHRMRELAVQADNGTYNNDDRKALDNEYKQLLAEIDNIADKTTFNGVKLIDTANNTINFHIGDGATDTLSITLKDANAVVLGVDANKDGVLDDVNGDAATGDNLTTFSLADDPATTTVNESQPQAAIKVIDGALDTITGLRAELGAYQNRLEFTVDNLNTSKVNIEAARSRVEDADMAKEMSELTKNRILSQSSMSMIQQSNQNQQIILQLLQG